MLGFEVVAAPLVRIVGDVLNRILPAEKMSEKERADVQSAVTLELLKADWQTTLAQIAVNAKEAESENVFVSGWRPFIGWVCGSAFMYHCVLQPVLVFLLVVSDKAPTAPLPVLDTATLMPVLMGMLGLGGLRTFEKLRGVNKTR